MRFYIRDKTSTCHISGGALLAYFATVSSVHRVNNLLNCVILSQYQRQHHGSASIFMTGIRHQSSGATINMIQDCNKKILCMCGCKKILTRVQSAQHMKNLAPNFIAASLMHRRALDMAYILTGLVPGIFIFNSYHNCN